jgi:hypothetical protein
MPEPEVYLRKWYLNTKFLSQSKHNALHYKWESVNAILGNSRCSFRKSHETQKHINTVCGQNAKILSIKAGDKYSYRCGMYGYNYRQICRLAYCLPGYDVA